MKRILLSLAAVVLFATPAAAQPDAWTEQVRRILQGVGAHFEADGYTLTHRIYTGALNEGGTEIVELDLDIGTEYQIMGACDTDCSDLDLTLYDGNGNVVDSDVLPDDAPLVTVTVSRSGAFTIEVSMATCSAEPCRYGIGVFGR
jgi:Bacterial pre-peptidase C-terminal domain